MFNTETKILLREIENCCVSIYGFGTTAFLTFRHTDAIGFNVNCSYGELLFSETIESCEGLNGHLQNILKSYQTAIRKSAVKATTNQHWD